LSGVEVEAHQIEAGRTAGYGQQAVIKDIDLLGNRVELLASVERQGKGSEAMVAKTKDLECVAFGVELEELVMVIGIGQLAVTVFVEYDVFEGRVGFEVVGIDPVCCRVVMEKVLRVFLQYGAIAGEVEGTAVEKFDAADFGSVMVVVAVDDLASGIEREKTGLCYHHIVTFSIAAGFENLVGPKGEDGIDGGFEGGKAMGCRVIAKGSAVCGADDIFILHLELGKGVSREGQVIRAHVIGGEEAAVEAVQAFGRGYPDITEGVLHEADDIIIGQTFMAGIVGEAGAGGGLGGNLHGGLGESSYGGLGGSSYGGLGFWGMPKTEGQ
jgi:hypothetical protein